MSAGCRVSRAFTFSASRLHSSVEHVARPPTSYESLTKGRKYKQSLVCLNRSPLQELGQRDGGRPEKGAQKTRIDFVSDQISTASCHRKSFKQRHRSGNKTTLITRLSEHDERQQRDALTSSPMQVRKASFASEPTGVPGLPNAPAPPPNARPDYFKIVLPDLTPRPEIESASIVRAISTTVHAGFSS